MEQYVRVRVRRGRVAHYIESKDGSIEHRTTLCGQYRDYFHRSTSYAATCHVCEERLTWKARAALEETGGRE